MRLNLFFELVRKIILVGCGEVGSRHLQAIMRLKKRVEVIVVEPRKNAINIGKKRIEEIPNNVIHELTWYKRIDDIQKSSDLVIIATQATGRAKLISQLIETHHSRFLIEKMVCQSVTEYDLLLKKFKKYNAKGWVNINRHYFSSYVKLRNLFHKNSHLSIVVMAGYLGLGSNAIHFIDLFSWFHNSYKIKLNGDYLVEKIFPNPRGNHLKEFAGTIIGSDNNSVLSITFLPFKNMPTTINIIDNNQQFLIDETNKKIINLRKNSNQQNHEFTYEHVSTVSTKVIHDIFPRDSCLLPTLEQSSYVHKELFRIFNNHLQKVNRTKLKLCPIT